MFERIKAFFKSLPFENSSAGAADVVIYPDVNAISAAVFRSISGAEQPSSDPNLSSLVAAAYAWLGTTLAEPDLLVKKEFQRKRGGKNRDDDVVERHPLYDLMRRPNPQTSGSSLWRAFAYSWIIDGNAYWIKYRHNSGRVVQLRNEPYFNVRARWREDRQGVYIPAERSQSIPSIPRNDQPNQFINYYELKRDSLWFRVEPDDVVHFRDGEDPFRRRYGLSRLKTVLREIYGDSAVATYAAQLLAGNGVIPYVLAIDDKEGLINEEDLLNIKTKMIEQTTGVNAGKPLVVTSRATVQKTGLTPQELDLRDARYMAQEVFAAVTGLPPQVLNFGAGLERSIYNNMKEADRRAIDQYLQPLWWHVAQELTAQLLPDVDTDGSHFVEFDLSEVGALQENQNDLWLRVGKAYQDGIIKRSEARTAIDYEADPDGLDDVYFERSGSGTVTPEQEEKEREAAMNAPEAPALIQGNDPRQLVGTQLRVAK